MKRNDIKKLAARSTEELTKEVSEAKEKLWQLGRDLASGKVKDSHAAIKLRRDIARMLTVVQNKTSK